jgi:hypothetical protein
MFWWGLFLSLSIFGSLSLCSVTAFVVLRRSYIRVTEDEVEYFNGWKTKRVIKRSSIVSAHIKLLGWASVIKIKCKDDLKGLVLPLAYSRTRELLHLLNQR